MIEHLVLFRCKESCLPAARESFIAAARALMTEIPEVIYGSAGENWSDRGDGYDLALTCRFEDKAALAVYQRHPVHQQFIAEQVKPHIEKVLAIDYFTA